MPSTGEIIEAIIQYRPERDNWTGLDGLLEDLWATGEPGKGTEALFGVFERFPEEDGNGVFWTILHGMESLPDHEPALVDSVRRQPTEFNVLMVNRILNTGRGSIGGVHGRTLLGEVRVHPGATHSARGAAGRYIERHQAPT